MQVDLKCVMLGKAAVGKTCLVERFLHDRWYQDPAPTVGAAFGASSINIGGNKQVTLGVWDTAGSERYESMTRHYYKGSEAAIIAYDLTDAASFEKVKFWVNEILAVEPDCMLSIVGTKLDLIGEGTIKPTTTSNGPAGRMSTPAHSRNSSSAPHSPFIHRTRPRGVLKTTALQYASSIGAQYHEVSALTGENVQQPFTELCKAWATRNSKRDSKSVEPVVQLKSSNEQAQKQSVERKGGGCCGGASI